MSLIKDYKMITSFIGQFDSVFWRKRLAEALIVQLRKETYGSLKYQISQNKINQILGDDIEGKWLFRTDSGHYNTSSLSIRYEGIVSYCKGENWIREYGNNYYIKHRGSLRGESTLLKFKIWSLKWLYPIHYCLWYLIQVVKFSFIKRKYGLLMLSLFILLTLIPGVSWWISIL